MQVSCGHCDHKQQKDFLPLLGRSQKSRCRPGALSRGSGAGSLLPQHLEPPGIPGLVAPSLPPLLPWSRGPSHICDLSLHRCLSFYLAPTRKTVESRLKRLHIVTPAKPYFHMHSYRGAGVRTWTLGGFHWSSWHRGRGTPTECLALASRVSSLGTGSECMFPSWSPQPCCIRPSSGAQRPGFHKTPRRS